MERAGPILLASPMGVLAFRSLPERVCFESCPSQFLKFSISRLGVCLRLLAIGYGGRGRAPGLKAYYAGFLVAPKGYAFFMGCASVVAFNGGISFFQKRYALR